MSRTMSRRSALRAVGAGGVGLAAVGGATAAAWEYGRGVPSLSDLAGHLPRVAEDARPTDRPSLGREEALGVASAPALASRLAELRLTPGAGLEHLGVDVIQQAVEFVCDPRRPNVLVVGASRVAYEIAEVAWQPAEGGPLYRTRSPLDAPAFKTRYAGVPRHQIVLLDDRAVFVNNRGSCGVLEGISGPLRVDVNGEEPGRHHGFYKVRITAIA